MKASYSHLMLLTLAAALMASCNSKATSPENTPAATETPVTVDTVRRSTMAEYIDLNATTAFLQKNIIKANTSGYVQTVNVHVGQFVEEGTVLFQIKTKEAQSIGNTINKLDPSFKFTGVNNIKASKSGYVSQMNHQLGDYVQDGEQLATVTDRTSFVFLLNVPYELHACVSKGKQVLIKLPDHTTRNGMVVFAFPTVDSQSQSQTYVVKTDAQTSLPENLVVSVLILKSEKQWAVSVPKAAVLSDDAQTDFWLMKLIDSNTAVKVAIKKGMETQDRIEVQSADIKPADVILVTGNFGLPDTAKVRVTNK